MDDATLYNPKKLFLIGLHDMLGKYQEMVFSSANGHDERYQDEPEIVTRFLEIIEERTNRMPGMSLMAKVAVVGISPEGEQKSVEVKPEP